MGGAAALAGPVVVPADSEPEETQLGDTGSVDGTSVRSRPVSPSSANAASAAFHRLPAAEVEKARAVLGLTTPAKTSAVAQAASVGPRVDLDPELKDKLKSARNWLNDAVPALPAGLQFDAATTPHPGSQDTSSRSGTVPAAMGGANTDARAGASGGRPEAVQSRGDAEGQLATTAAIFDLALEMVTHPGVLAVVGLVLAVKLLLATLRLKVARQDAQLRRQARRQGVANLAPSGDGSGRVSAGSRSGRPRQRSGHRNDG